jgi:hypothetical protein
MSLSDTSVFKSWTGRGKQVVTPTDFILPGQWALPARESDSQVRGFLSRSSHALASVFEPSDLAFFCPVLGRIQNVLVKVSSSSPNERNCPTASDRLSPTETTLKPSHGRMSFLLACEGRLCPARAGWLKRVRRETARSQKWPGGRENVLLSKLRVSGSIVYGNARASLFKYIRLAPGCKSEVPQCNSGS